MCAETETRHSMQVLIIYIILTSSSSRNSPKFSRSETAIFTVSTPKFSALLLTLDSTLDSANGLSN